jgi:putative tryptophan/tyrosine transport system substrate-binding protein
MRRREFIAGLGSAAAWSAMARAQQSALPVIGFLHPGAPTFADYADAFREGLGQQGFRDGQNVTVEHRWAEDHLDRLPALAAELVGRRVAVIVTARATSAVLAAKAATSTIPIVFAVGADPVKAGLVASLNRPGGNVTGVSFLANSLVAKQLQLLREVVPAATVIGLLVNPDNPNAQSDAGDVEAAAGLLGQQIQIVHAHTESDLNLAFASLVQMRAAALLALPDTFFSVAESHIAELAALHQMPSIYSRRTYAEAGGLMSYGASVQEAIRQVGIYAGRILNGEMPANLPVQQSTKFELIINFKTAKALGLMIPETLLATADQVIE